MLGKACADAEFEHRPITGLTRPIAAMSNSTPSARVLLQTWCARRFLATVRLTAGPSSGVISKDAKMARWIAEQFGCRAKAMTHKIGGTSGEEPELKEPERSRPIPLRRQPTEKSFCGAAGLGSASNFRRRFPFRSARDSQNLPNLGRQFSLQSSVAARLGGSQPSINVTPDSPSISRTLHKSVFCRVFPTPPSTPSLPSDLDEVWLPRPA
jgi:hypothetical protein